MLKRSISFLMLIVLALSVTGCKAAEYAPAESRRTKDDMYGEMYGDPTSDASSSEDTRTMEEKQADAAQAEKFGETYSEVRLNPDYLQIPDRRIFLNPPQYTLYEEENSWIYCIADDRFVSVVVAKDETASTPQEAFEVCAQKFYPDIQSYNKAFAIDVISESEGAAHGIPLYAFEGQLTSLTKKGDKEYNPYCYCVSFVMDNTPCMILGALISRSQSEADIIDIHDTVIEMVNTLRSVA